jgi:3-phenylpropionate/trans-cinnamate dioxygenase ferredoxin reductase component
MADSRKFVVVGGGLAAAKAVEALRDKGFEGVIELYGAEPHLPYERPPLSKSYLKTGEGLADAFVHTRQWYLEHRVGLHLGSRVTELALLDHEIGTDTGERLRYDKLVLATGSSPRQLHLPGAELEGVLYLRTIEDSDRLRAAFRPGAEVVFVGGGWIGLEAASAAVEAGSSVTVLEALDLPLVRVLGPEVATVFAGLHREKGVDLRTTVEVSAIEGEHGQVRCVRLADGTSLTADTVVVGIGALPNIELAEYAGLRLDNGIVVDAQGRTSDPDVFAVGDVANHFLPFLHQHVRVEHWATALNQPTAVAAAMLDRDEVYDELPYFYTDQYDLGMEYIGHAGPDDEVVVRGDLGSREFLAFWLRDGRVVAGMAVNIWDVVDDVKAVVRGRRPVDRALLADPAVPLQDFA